MPRRTVKLETELSLLNSIETIAIMPLSIPLIWLKISTKISPKTPSLLTDIRLLFGILSANYDLEGGRKWQLSFTYTAPMFPDSEERLVKHIRNDNNLNFQTPDQDQKIGLVIQSSPPNGYPARYSATRTRPFYFSCLWDSLLLPECRHLDLLRKCSTFTSFRQHQVIPCSLFESSQKLAL